MDTIQLIRRIIRSRALPTRSEYEFQQAVGELLVQAGFDTHPEHRLDAQNRIDFYLPKEQIGIETKMRAEGGSTMRQLLRYAMTGKFTQLILITPRPLSNLLPGFEVNGKFIPLHHIQTAGL
jgi:hypothetical protein